MPDRIIAKTDLRQWLASLVASFRVVAPIGRDGGPATWGDVKDASTSSACETDVGPSQMLMAAKEFLLPAYEPLFTYQGPKKDAETGPTLSTQNSALSTDTLMIGLKLCDAQAISVLDSVYLKGQFRDPYYAARREKLALVATVCDDPRWSCFCTSVGDLEEWTKGVDALITDLGESIYVAPVTETGEKLVQGSFFRDPTADQTAKKDQVWTNLLALPKKSFAGKDISKKVDWEDPMWAEMAQKCIGCAVCSYMCPSCSCFDIQDQTTGSTIERYRCRDTCQSTDFTLMGAGHNPRPEKKMRVRQRVMHKFKYQMEQFQMLGCTGCGRCVENCPVNIDLRAVLERVAGEGD